MPYSVLWVPTGAEFEVERKLLDLGLNVYCPRSVETGRNRKSKSIRDRFMSWTKPLFPGYLFLHADSEPIPQNLGVRRSFLMMDGKLLLLTDAQYDAVRAVEKEIAEEFRNEKQHGAHSFNKGDMVVVRNGALEGHRGRVVFVHKTIAKVSFPKWPIEMSIFATNLQLDQGVLK